MLEISACGRSALRRTKFGKMRRAELGAHLKSDLKVDRALSAFVARSLTSAK
jgi:hypothetical protein